MINLSTFTAFSVIWTILEGVRKGNNFLRTIWLTINQHFSECFPSWSFFNLAPDVPEAHLYVLVCVRSCRSDEFLLYLLYNYFKSILKDSWNCSKMQSCHLSMIVSREKVRLRFYMSFLINIWWKEFMVMSVPACQGSFDFSGSC